MAAHKLTDLLIRPQATLGCASQLLQISDRLPLDINLSWGKPLGKPVLGRLQPSAHSEFRQGQGQIAMLVAALAQLHQGEAL